VSKEHDISIVVEEAVRAAMKEELKLFYIDRKQHYDDHEFIKDVRDSAEKVRGAACKATTYGILALFGGWLLWSFRHWLLEIFSPGIPK
jgi:hypothetical protein